MPGVRELLAVGLGVLVGLALLVAPRTALRLSVFAGPQRRRRRGDYGSDDPIPDWWAHLVRVAGAACVVVAAVIAYQSYA